MEGSNKFSTKSKHWKSEIIRALQGMTAFKRERRLKLHYRDFNCENITNLLSYKFIHCIVNDKNLIISI
jgi:hypothetical protein